MRLSWVILSVACWLVAGVALAQKPVTVHVIALDSDDASEDQADALTAALRNRVRQTPTFQLADSNQSLATLLPALRCPTRPDSACLQRIGDQLKTDRFFWGSVGKASIAHQVAAEVHLWTRGRPEQVARETFADNVKDQNDDALKRVAAALFDHLTGNATQGTILVHVTGVSTGTVVVDGKPAGQLVDGQATVQVASGTHSVQIQSPSGSAPPQDVNVVVNVQSEVTFAVQSAAPLTPSGKPSDVRKPLGFVSLGLAGASAVATGVLAALFASDSSSFNTARGQIPSSIAHPCTSQTDRNAAGTYVNIGSACSHRDAADTEGTLAWVFAGTTVGFAVLGVILVTTTGSGKEGSATSSVRLLPSIGPQGGSLTASFSF